MNEGNFYCHIQDVAKRKPKLIDLQLQGAVGVVNSSLQRMHQVENRNKANRKPACVKRSVITDTLYNIHLSHMTSVLFISVTD